MDDGNELTDLSPDLHQAQTPKVCIYIIDELYSQHQILQKYGHRIMTNR